MPLYIWHTTKSYTVSTDYKEAPIWAQIIVWSNKRFEEIMEKYSDNPNAIENDEQFGVFAKAVKKKAMARVEEILDEDCMTCIELHNME